MPLVEDDDEDVNTFLPTSNIQQSLAVLVQVCVSVYSVVCVYICVVCSLLTHVFYV